MHIISALHTSQISSQVVLACLDPMPFSVLHFSFLFDQTKSTGHCKDLLVETIVLLSVTLHHLIGLVHNTLGHLFCIQRMCMPSHFLDQVPDTP